MSHEPVLTSVVEGAPNIVNSNETAKASIILIVFAVEDD